MSNGKGLKDQWGVTDPAKAGSDKQAQEFQACFQKEIAAISGHLQYTSANAEAARHDPLAARRDALYTAFQAALGQIDRTNPAKAKSAIDKVLADARALDSEVAKFHKEAEKARNDWQARQPKYDAAVHQVEELESWGDAKAAPLRGLVDGVRAQTNERKYAQACAVLDQLLPKLKPIYEDYQKQKAAKPKYEQALAEQTSKLDALRPAERPSQTMTAKVGEADTALGQARAKADAKDYVGGLEEMKTTQTAVAALDKLAKDPQRVKFLADRKVAEEEVKTATSDTTFKSLEADRNAITQLKDQTDPAADSGDYAGANKMLTDLKAKLTALQKKAEELKKQKQAYDDALKALQPQLDEALKSKYTPLAPRLTEITTLKGQMEAAAQSEDFAAALKSANDLKAKVDAFLPDLKKLQQAEQDYKKAWAALEPKLGDALLSSRAFKSLDAARTVLDTGKGNITTAATAQDFEKALQLTNDLAPKVDDYLKNAKVEEDKVQKKADDITKQLDGASDATRGDVAKAAAKGLSEEEIKSLPTAVRNRLMEEMQKGGLTDDEKSACKHLFSEKYLDPKFEKLDDENRKKLIDKMKNDPDFKKARDNWATMTENERIAVLKKAADYQAEAYGIPVTTVEAYSPKNPDGTLRRQRMGEYSHSDGKLKISREAMQDKGFDTVLDTVVHENGHRYQNTLVDKLNKKPPEIKPGDPLYDQAMTFKLNDAYYVQPKIKSTDAPTPDRGDEYFTQPMEYHSRRTGEDVAAAGIGK